MDHLQEYYDVTGDQEHNIANPVVGMNCAALFAGLLCVFKKVGRFLPARKLCFLVHWQGRKKSKPNYCSGQVNFALGIG